MVLGQALFLVAIAFFVAALEVEIEGEHGWAEKLPTWYRTRGVFFRLVGFFNGYKPLTGYHVFLHAAFFFLFHWSFVVLWYWSVAEELQVLALYLTWICLWDFFWFLLNPHYGLRKFRPRAIWWHARSFWLFGVVLWDYVVDIVLALLFVVLASYLSGTWLYLVEYLWMLGVFVIATMCMVLVAPLYQGWYLKMREIDDRDVIPRER